MPKFSMFVLLFSAFAFAGSEQFSAPAATGFIDLKGTLFELASELLPLFIPLFLVWILKEFLTSSYFVDRRMKSKGYERYEPRVVKRGGHYYRKKV